MTNFALLGDVCEFLDHKRKPVTEGLRTSGPYPYYGANGQQGWIDSFLFNEPLILLAEDGGHFGSKTKPIAYKIEGKTWVNNHAHVLRPRSDCDIDFLAHMLSFLDVSKYINGSTRPKLTKGNAEDIRIPFPPLAEQKRLSKLLDRANKVRLIRRHALQMCDEIIPAAFCEMFGDPQSNPYRYPVENLGSLLSHSTTLGTTVPCAQSGKYTCVRVGEIGNEEIDYTSCGRVDLSSAELARYSVENGDILLARAIGSVDHLGKLTVVKRNSHDAPVVHDSHVMRIRTNSAVLLPTYLASMLRTPGGRALFMRQARRTAVQFNVNSEQIETLNLPLPPLNQQHQFADNLAILRKLRATEAEALRQADHLFRTLLNEAIATRQ
jgi:type I restriction enzyme S subunit